MEQCFRNCNVVVPDQGASWVARAATNHVQFYTLPSRLLTLAGRPLEVSDHLSCMLSACFVDFSTSYCPASLRQ
jgi:hypothetical protein